MPIPPPTVERLDDEKPIIERILDHPWESRVTFNPACALVSDRWELETIIQKLPIDQFTKNRLSSHDALCFVLYRAQGAKTGHRDYTHSSIGLAICTPELKPLARLTEPVILPDRDYDNLGVEDARVTKVGNRYIMMYTAYASGQSENRIRIALASTADFVRWEKHGVLKGDFNQLDNKNAMLFEEKIGGKYVMLHRPMEGKDRMMIHWAESDDLFGEWKSRGLLMKPISNPQFVDTWIGGGAPPLRLSNGQYLVLYHIGNRKTDGSREYDLGIAVVDTTSPNPIVKRDEPLLRPQTPSETIGDAQLGVNNVVFICGAHFYQGDLYFPYAGADTCVLAGRIKKKDLEDYIGSPL